MHGLKFNKIPFHSVGSNIFHHIQFDDFFLNKKMLLKFTWLVLFMAYFVDNVSNQPDESVDFPDSTHSVTCFNQILYHGQIGQQPNNTVSNCAQCEVGGFYFTLSFNVICEFFISFSLIKL